MQKPIISLILVYKDSSKTVKNCIESILSQVFQSFELVCVDIGATDETSNIVEEYAQKDNRIKNIKIDEEIAKKAAAMLTIGDYICFIDETKVYNENFLNETYRQMTHEKDTKFKFKKDTFYNRNFIESFDKIEKIIENQIKEQSTKLKELLQKNKESILEEQEKRRIEQIETIYNKNYDLIIRFEQLEQNFYKKEKDLKESVQRLWDEKFTIENTTVNLQPIYDELYTQKYKLESEMNVKGSEISKIYDDITKNYKYTEELMQTEKEFIYDAINKNFYNLDERLKKLEEYESLKFSNIKSLFNSQLNEICSRLKYLESNSNENFEREGNNISTEKLFESISEKMYAHVNSVNGKFYKELTSLYKDVDEKISEAQNNQQYKFEQRLTRVKDEIMSELKKELAQIKEELLKK